MDPRSRDRVPSDDAVEFVRFCYRRRGVGWPELYDEMCAVANRGLFRGWGCDDLTTHGIGFSLFEMSTLAALVHRVVAEEHERRAEAAGVVVAIRPSVVTELRPREQPQAIPVVEAAPETQVVPVLRFAGATA
ncbi:MAG TPA: hypothetical protein VGC90_01030 [Candidatus Limnocylindrales bacterium]|jgi:hypothetical protein